MGTIKGWLGEKKTAFVMWLSLNDEIYRRYHNVIIPSNNGTTQIDHIIVSKFGIFIVETKNMKGWIFGDKNSKNWTQVIYRSKSYFQNPLRQVFRQSKILSEFLEIDESLIHSIVRFSGECKFKTDMPLNVMKSGLSSYIKGFRREIISQSELDRIRVVLDGHVSDKSLTTNMHVHSLRERHSSKTLCPSCGSALVVRTVRNGPKAGSKFLGCDSYPRCRFTRNMQ